MESKKISELVQYNGSASGFMVPGVADDETQKADLGAMVDQAAGAAGYLKPSGLKTINGESVAGSGDIALESLNPFKGYYPAGSAKPDSGSAGDYLYAPDSTDGSTTTIWAWGTSLSTPNWMDTSVIVDASVIAALATGQQVQNLAVKNEKGATSSSNNLLSAESGATLNTMILDRYHVEGKVSTHDAATTSNANIAIFPSGFEAGETVTVLIDNHGGLVVGGSLRYGSTFLNDVAVPFGKPFELTLPVSSGSLNYYGKKGVGSVTVTLSKGAIDARVESVENGLARMALKNNLLYDDLFSRRYTLNSAGTAPTYSASYSLSDFIAVTGGSNLVYPRGLSDKINQIRFYNSGKSVVGSVITSLQSYLSVQIPSSASYMRVVITRGYEKALTMYEVADIATVSIDDLLGDDTQTELTQKMTTDAMVTSGILVEEGVGVNLINPDNIIPFTTIDVNSSSATYGQIIASLEYSVTRKIAVVPNVLYWSNCNYIVYSSNGNSIGLFLTSGQSKYNVMPSNAAYIRAAYKTSGSGVMSNPMICVADNVLYTEGKNAAETAWVFTEQRPPFVAVQKAQVAPSTHLNQGFMFTEALRATRWYGKKMTVNGDSITHDQGKSTFWQYIVSQRLGLSLVDGGAVTIYSGADQRTFNIGKSGIGGARIAKGQIYGTVGNKTYGEINGLISEGVYGDSCISENYTMLPDDADLVIIAGGTNDWSHGNISLGTMTDRTNETFYGALHVLCLGLMEKYLEQATIYRIPQIVFMTPIKRMGLNAKVADVASAYQNAIDPSVDVVYHTLEDFVNAIIEVCGYYGIPVIDMFHECTLNPGIPAQRDVFFGQYLSNGVWTEDNTHPNTVGHLAMGTLVSQKLRSI